jgi:hypothetical protein
MKGRLSDLIFTLGTIALGIVSLILAAKIIKIRGAAYKWEYIPPILVLLFGVTLLAKWFLGIFQKR